MSYHNGTGAGPKSDTMGGAEKLAPPLARFPHGASEQSYYLMRCVVPVSSRSKVAPPGSRGNDARRLSGSRACSRSRLGGVSFWR